MAKEKVYFRAQGETFGPFSQAEFLENLKSGNIPFYAWFHTEASGWRLLSEDSDLRAQHPEFEEKPSFSPEDVALGQKPKKTIKAVSRLRPSSYSGGTVSAEPVWFVIRDKKKHGPYSAAEIIGQLQRKDISGSAFVWRPGFDNWRRLSGVDEFSKESMRRLATESTPVDILVKRKFARSPYEVEVIAHDNTKVVQGKSMVVGQGGLFLSVARPTHPVGARLKLHFTEGKTAPFNAVAEIVSVVRGSDSGYCMRFVAIADADKRRIAKLVSEKK